MKQHNYKGYTILVYGKIGRRKWVIQALGLSGKSMFPLIQAKNAIDRWADLIFD